MIYYNPDITMGFNIFTFDDNYIHNRVLIYSQYDNEIS